MGLKFSCLPLAVSMIGIIWLGMPVWKWFLGIEGKKEKK
jgi:hypothetical protein